jgi:hypothetical protein
MQTQFIWIFPFRNTHNTQHIQKVFRKLPSTINRTNLLSLSLSFHIPHEHMNMWVVIEANMCVQTIKTGGTILPFLHLFFYIYFICFHTLAISLSVLLVCAVCALCVVCCVHTTLIYIFFLYMYVLCTQPDFDFIFGAQRRHIIYSNPISTWSRFRPVTYLKINKYWRRKQPKCCPLLNNGFWRKMRLVLYEDPDFSNTTPLWSGGTWGGEIGK